MVMACTIEKVLADARLLVTRLKEHDSSADTLIAHTSTLHKRVDAMKQYEEDLNELNEIARHKPRAQLVLGIAQENSQIRELQMENKELRLCLEEHQSALELIMSKYREQIHKLVLANKLDRNTVHTDGSEEAQIKIDKICEMAAVMQKAVKIDEEFSTKDQETIAQLQVENKTLRELLQISVVNQGTNGDSTDAETQTDAQDESLDDSMTNSLDDSPNSSMNTIKRRPPTAKGKGDSAETDSVTSNDTAKTNSAAKEEESELKKSPSPNVKNETSKVGTSNVKSDPPKNAVSAGKLGASNQKNASPKQVKSENLTKGKVEASKGSGTPKKIDTSGKTKGKTPDNTPDKKTPKSKKDDKGN